MPESLNRSAARFIGGVRRSDNANPAWLSINVLIDIASGGIAKHAAMFDRDAMQCGKYREARPATRDGVPRAQAPAGTSAMRAGRRADQRPVSFRYCVRAATAVFAKSENTPSMPAR